MFKRPLVGWYLTPAEASHVFYAPERLSRQRASNPAIKSVQTCPAVQALESRIFVIRCPFSLALKLRPTTRKASRENPYEVYTVAEKTKISAHHLRKIFRLMPRDQWRQENTPVFQIATPYVFVTDHAFHIRQTGPYLHCTDSNKSGFTISGEFPLKAWPRQLSFGFEWCMTKETFVMKRGQPWFYIEFLDKDEKSETTPRVKRIIPSRQLEEYQAGTHGVVDRIENTFGLIRGLQKGKKRPLLRNCTIDERQTDE